MKLFVGCSSSDLIDEKYLNESKKFLEEIFKEDNDLVFGACDNGLMGYAYRIAKENKRNIIGICPLAYKDDFKFLECTIELIEPTISKRTEAVIENSDGLIIFPGGIGTIYELFNIIESKRNYEFDKPIVIYNLNGFYDEILDFLNKLCKEKFVKEKNLNIFYVATSAKEALEYLYNYK